MKYRLVFSGELIGSVHKEDCLAQLAELFGKDFDSVKAKLFRGRPIVVKKTSDQQVADRFVSAFEKAGAVLKIEVPGLGVIQRKPARSPDSKTPEPKAAWTQAERDTEATRLRPAMSRPGELPAAPAPKLTEDDMTRQRPVVPEQDDR